MVDEIYIDGEPATVASLSEAAFNNYAAFTSMQVEGGGVRGLYLHIRRLKDSALELFGAAPSETRLRDRMRAAIDGRQERLSLRVQLFLPSISYRRAFPKGEPRVLVRVSEPMPPLRGALRLQVQDYARETPLLKHTATYGLMRAARTAQQAGFDDALFVGSDDLVSEGSIWNIGFIEDQRVVWPKAPKLAGVGQALIERGLEMVGLDSETRPITRADIAGFDAAFVCNSSTPACAVQSINDHEMGDHPDLIDRLQAARATNPREAI